MTSVQARPSPPRDGTVDVLHGVSVADPFRPLERADDPATAAWVAGEDEIARAALAALPGRDAMAGFLRAIWDYPKASVPERHGRAWRDAVRGTKKQTSFDDFIACAEWLVRERITRATRLAISGGSNGGLLVAAPATASASRPT